MSSRWFTRLTSSLSKKIENHWAAVALHFAHYNFCRPHSSLRTEHDVGARERRDLAHTTSSRISTPSACASVRSSSTGSR